MTALKISAWLDPGDRFARASFQAHAALLARVYPRWLFVDEKGMPQRRSEAGPEHREGLLGLARAQGVEVWSYLGLSVVPGSASDVPRLLLEDDACRSAHRSALLRLAQEDGVQGLILDYGTVADADRKALISLLDEIRSVLHGIGLKVALLARPSLGPGKPGGYSPTEDYAALASRCDRVQIVGCSFPEAGVEPSDAQRGRGIPGPIAAPAWCGEVLAHAVSSAPHEKIEWCLPALGANWGGDAFPVSINFRVWEALVQAHPPERRDSVTAEMHLSYGGRDVWMNDSISLIAKLGQVRLHGVSNVALSNLGAEDPRLWALLDTLPKDFLGTEQA